MNRKTDSIDYINKVEQELAALRSYVREVANQKLAAPSMKGLTRYGVGFMNRFGPMPEGDYVKLADVQARMGDCQQCEFTKGRAEDLCETWGIV